MVGTVRWAARTSQRDVPTREFTPSIGRRAFVLGTIVLAAAGGGVALGRKLYRATTFSYDGTQYKGSIVQPITPNDLFDCVQAT